VRGIQRPPFAAAVEIRIMALPAVVRLRWAPVGVGKAVPPTRVPPPILQNMHPCVSL
jgi:hypothetical protein